jgi:hypothetical protein
MKTYYIIEWSNELRRNEYSVEAEDKDQAEHLYIECKAKLEHSKIKDCLHVTWEIEEGP